MGIAPITQLPIFVFGSLAVSRACQFPTILDTESFLTLTSLAHSDPTLTLPIALGVISLANVESARWFISPEATERQKKVDEWKMKRRERGETIIEPGKIVQSSLRILAVCRILFAALLPGVRIFLYSDRVKGIPTNYLQAVQLYWLTSATFGLGQSWVFDFIEARKRRRRALADAKERETAAQPPSTLVFMKRGPSVTNPKSKSVPNRK